MKAISTLIALMFVGGLFLASYSYFQLRPAGSDSQKIIFEVEPGPFKSVTEKLFEQGFIRNKKIFTLYAHFLGADQKIKAGEFEIAKNLWAGDLLKILTNGKNYQRTFTIQEGLNIFEIAELLESKGIVNKKDFINYVTNRSNVEKLLGINVDSLEGYLYPDTYKYTKNMHIEKIVTLMVEHFNRVIDQIAPQLNKDKKLRHKMVILASMVEKETGAPEERSVIASVFYNRMKKNMRFQSDPTVIYGLEVKTKELVKNIHKSDLSEKNPYNTYRINGLPVGPIANPGKDSLLAVLKPEKTEYLYFVSMNEGRHHFSRTYKEHEKAVAKYQMDKRARQGKSWRHLKDTVQKER